MNGVALLIFARSAGFVSRAPGLSHPSVPHAVRAMFALLLTLALAPAMPRFRAPDGFALVVAFVLETAIGAAIGVAASLLYDGAYAGGRAIDDYAGIRGSVPNAPLYAASGFGRICSTVFLAAFFLLGGYRMAIETFANSFERLPPGALPSAHQLLQYAVSLPVIIVQAALLVAGPAIALIFVAQWTLGALTRVIPRFSAFALSFPIVFALAILAIGVTMLSTAQTGALPWMPPLFHAVHP